MIELQSFKLPCH